MLPLSSGTRLFVNSVITQRQVTAISSILIAFRHSCWVFKVACWKQAYGFNTLLQAKMPRPSVVKHFPKVLTALVSDRSGILEKNLDPLQNLQHTDIGRSCQKTHTYNVRMNQHCAVRHSAASSAQNTSGMGERCGSRDAVLIHDFNLSHLLYHV